MRSINIETLMSHSIGVSNSYYRPTEDELLNDYLKAVPFLTSGDYHRTVFPCYRHYWDFAIIVKGLIDRYYFHVVSDMINVVAIQVTVSLFEHKVVVEKTKM